MGVKRLIVDGNNLAHLYKYVYGQLYNKKRIPTGVVYGFLNQLYSLINTFSPDCVYVTWDCDGQSARSLVYPEYKSARRSRHMTKQERDRLKQFHDIELPMLKEILASLGIQQLQYDLLEADDVIALAVNRDRACDWVIVSNDKDYIQWVSGKRVRVYAPTSGYLFYQEPDLTVVGGKTEFGMVLPSPETYAVWRAIIGDKSDSISGVPGIGATTVYECFMDSAPVHSLEDERAVIRYLRSGYYANARGKKLEEAAVTNGPVRTTIMDTLTIMRPTVSSLSTLLDKAKATAKKSSKTTRRFVEGDVLPRSTIKINASYLKNVRRDPNPFVTQLRRLDFDIGYRKNSWYPVLSTFDKLYTRSEKACAT